MTTIEGRLILVSNRLPVSLKRQGENLRVEPSPGGLATALSAVWNSYKDGIWIGWPGATVENVNIQDLLDKVAKEGPYQLRAVILTAQEVERFYAGFANEIIWPLFHDLQSRCNFRPEYWEAYQKVNRKYARAVASSSSSEDLIWVHDYQLMLVAQNLREMGSRSRLGFFQHIPFPPPDVFEKLPWRDSVLRGLLEFDVLGFQTSRDRANFIACVAELLPEAEIHDGDQQQAIVHLGGRRVIAGAFPISIDFDEFAVPASQPDVAARATAIRSELMENILLLGVDRMDYTKGIPERLQAFRLLLERFPELRRQISLVQIVVPSRSDIPEYKGLREEVELLVSQINGQFTQPGWVPIHYMYRNMPRHDLLAYYRAADVALITPLKDGMNLVAKEFCAAQIDERGVLVLSEFAGASPELRHGAILVNPNDFVGVANAIRQAVQMPPEEKLSRMRLLREIVKNHNIQRWTSSFLTAATSIVRDDSVPSSNGKQTQPTSRDEGTPGVALVARALTSRLGGRKITPRPMPTFLAT
ncbi:MAG TPA: trehalose-6-phosphate synthase [Terriglobales bacterium]|nr:trehalose-6-phosphate synthase [Terriglobales bacterium]